MNMLDRAGALTGAVAAALIVTALLTSDPYAAGTAYPGAPADAIASAFEDKSSAARTGAWLSLAAVFLLMVFVARLHGALHEAAAASWLPTVALLGGVGLIAVQLAYTTWLFAVSEPAAWGGANRPVVVTLLALDWNSASTLAAPFAGLLLGSLAVAWQHHVFPAWFTWVTAALALAIAALSLSGTAGLAALPGLVWVFAASLTLAFAHAEPSAPASRSARSAHPA